MWCFCKALWHGLANLEWLLKTPWNDTWRLIWKSFWGRPIYSIVFNQGIEHQEWVQVKIHRRMERSQGQSLHMPILILWIIWKIAEPQTTKMKRANNQGPTDAFSSGAFLEVLATLPRWVMFLLCFSLAIRILCLATIFAAPPAPRTSRTRSLARRSRATGREARLCSRCLRCLQPLGRDAERWTPVAADRGGLSSRWGGAPGTAGRRAERQESNHRTVQPATSN